MNSNRKISNLKLSNDLFAKFLQSNNLVLSTDVLVETTPDINSAISINHFANNGKSIILLKGNLDKIVFPTDEFINGQTPNFICNGFFDHITDYTKMVIYRGSFNIGICTPDRKVFNSNKSKFQALSSKLAMKGVPIVEKEEVISSHKLYLLSYRMRTRKK